MKYLLLSLILLLSLYNIFRTTATKELIFNFFQTEPALMYDSVAVFAAGLEALDRSHKLKPMNLSCDQEIPWEDGTSLYNYLNAVRICLFSQQGMMLFFNSHV